VSCSCCSRCRPRHAQYRYTAYDVTANITGTKGAWLGSWNIQSDAAQFGECGWPEFIEETRAWGGDDIANDYTHCCQARALLMQRLQVAAAAGRVRATSAHSSVGECGDA
jgi:hypothetical protein